MMTYVRFPLLLRNVEDLLFERGIDPSHEQCQSKCTAFSPFGWRGTKCSQSICNVLNPNLFDFEKVSPGPLQAKREKRTRC